MKKIIQISFSAILIAGAIFLVGFTGNEHRGKTYHSFRILVLNAEDQAMISDEEIRELVREQFGDIEGSRMTAVNLHKLENFIRGNPYISSCEAYQTLSGTLTLKARAREPLVRIFNQDLEQYLIDYNGCLMPVNPAKPFHLLIANGHITEHYSSPCKTVTKPGPLAENSILREIYTVAMHISQDAFLSSFIDQVYVNEKQELELIPKIGHQVIYFGKAEDTAEKLGNLKAFYQQVMSKIDWRIYSSIDLKYKNQVVCTK